VNDAHLRVCLERSLALAATQLRFRDWPGFGGPIVHLPDPFVATQLVERIAAELAPRVRVLSLEPRADVSYQTDADDLLGFLNTFGFLKPVLLSEGRACIAAVLVAVWQPTRVAGIVMVNPDPRPPCDLTGLAARGLRECPPDWTTLTNSVSCPLLTLDGLAIDAVEAFVAAIDPPG
jgi:pimeloyl-ACP methyl ester carboxylesterase